MNPDNPTDPSVYEKIPTEVPPDPLNVSAQDFKRFWFRKLQGFNPDENIDFKNPEHVKRYQDASAVYDQNEAILKGMAPDIFLYNDHTMAIGLLEKIHRSLVERAMAEGKPVSEEAISSYADLKKKLSAGSERKDLQTKINERLAKIIVTNFDNIDAASSRNEVRFAAMFKDVFTKLLPGIEVKIERDDRVYKFELDGLTYTVVFPNSPIPRKYEMAYRGAPSFSKVVRANKSPAVIMMTDSREGEFNVVREGEVEI